MLWLTLIMRQTYKKNKFYIQETVEK